MLAMVLRVGRAAFASVHYNVHRVLDTVLKSKIHCVCVSGERQGVMQRLNVAQQL